MTGPAGVRAPLGLRVALDGNRRLAVVDAITPRTRLGQRVIVALPWAELEGLGAQQRVSALLDVLSMIVVGELEMKSINAKLPPADDAFGEVETMLNLMPGRTLRV